jgi:hypothetical protein
MNSKRTIPAMHTAALEILRKRTREVSGAEREGLVKIGVAYAEHLNLDRADLATAELAIELSSPSVKEKIAAMVADNTKRAVDRGLGHKAILDEHDTAVRCCASWFCGWDSLTDAAMCAVGMHLEPTWASIAETTRQALGIEIEGAA